MLSKVSFRNFKCLRDMEIDLERFTVFVGPNASGKSSILQGLDLLCRLFGDQEEGTNRELMLGVNRGSDGTVVLAVQCATGCFRYRLGPIQAPRNGWNGNGRGFADDLTSANWKNWSPDQSKVAPLPLSALLRLEGSRLISAVPAAPDPSVMASDGTGLHSALANMALNDPDAWRQLQLDLRRMIPSIRRLRHTKATSAQQPAELLFDTVGADSLLASQVSEGTLLVLGLLAALHAPNRPSLILLDDLDRALHPKAQRELIAYLREIMKVNADLQIMATTHSPYLLDWMELNEVRMTTLREDGSSACAPLSRHPQFEKWKDEMAPGEMWSLFGEKWLVEQEVGV